MDINFSDFSAENGCLIVYSPTGTFKSARGIVSSSLQKNENLVFGTVVLAPENHKYKKGDTVGFLRSDCYKIDNDNLSVETFKIRLHKKQ
jgi:hypothetical protein